MLRYENQICRFEEGFKIADGKKIVFRWIGRSGEIRLQWRKHRTLMMLSLPEGNQCIGSHFDQFKSELTLRIEIVYWISMFA